MSEKVAIVGATRTPIGAYLGTLRDVEAHRLLSTLLKETLDSLSLPFDGVDEVVAGESYQNGENVNIARMASLEAGMAEETRAMTIDSRCLSGLDAMIYGAMQIILGEADMVIASGVESMSNAEFYIPGSVKWGIGRKMGLQFVDSPKGHGSLGIKGIPLYDRIQRAREMSLPLDRYPKMHSNVQWADNIARLANISREACDQWACISQQKAIKAIDKGYTRNCLIPVGEVTDDENPRRNVSLEALENLPTILEDGVCTAGNSAGEADGAACVILTSEKKAKQLGLEPLAYVNHWSRIAANPEIPPDACTLSVNHLLEKSNLVTADIDLFEIQESFASQIIYNLMQLKLTESDYARINVNGSALAFGHPIAATSLTRCCDLIYELQRRQGQYGLISAPAVGGIASACLIEKAIT